MREQLQPAQHQKHQPGRESVMRPRPHYAPRYPGVGKLKDKVAVITGGDSGIGRAVAVAMAREGAKIAVIYLEEHQDAEETLRAVRAEGSTGIRIAGDVGQERFCREAIAQVMKELGRIDILVNNAAEQHEVHGVDELTERQIERTFRTNVYSFFFMVKAALPYLKEGASIINTSSITAYKGHRTLLDYSATKGAISTMTYSLSEALLDKGIRVNAVAPGPVWTPLIPASFSAAHVARHGAAAPMHRPGEPNEVAPCYVFLASEEAAYITGQVLHVNGGTVVGG